MSNIAVLYSGNIRSFEIVAEFHNLFLSELKKNHNVKIFTHTWDKVESTTKSWWIKSDSNNKENEIEYIQNLIKSSLKPELSQISSYSSLDNKYVPDYYKSQISYSGIKCMLQSNFLVWKLFQKFAANNDWKADIVIRIRYDIDFDFELFIKNLNCVINKNRVLTFFSENWAFAGVYSDIIIAFNYENAKVFYNSLNTFCYETLLKKYFEIYSIFIPEVFFYKYILTKVKYLSIRSKLNIVRTTGEISKVSTRLITNNNLKDFIKLNSNRTNIYKNISLAISDFLFFLNQYKLSEYNKILKNNLNIFVVLTFLIKSLKSKFQFKILLQVLKFKIEFYNTNEKNSYFNTIILALGSKFLKNRKA